MKRSEIENLVNEMSREKVVTQSIVRKSQLIAQFIQNEMSNLEINYLMECKYILSTSSQSDESLYIRYGDDNNCDYKKGYACLNVSDVDTQRCECFTYNQLNVIDFESQHCECFIYTDFVLPNRNDILEFVSDAKYLIQVLVSLSKDYASVNKLIYSMIT